jgi:hypothetical protein
VIHGYWGNLVFAVIAAALLVLIIAYFVYISFRKRGNDNNANLEPEGEPLDETIAARRTLTSTENWHRLTNKVGGIMRQLALYAALNSNLGSYRLLIIRRIEYHRHSPEHLDPQLVVRPETPEVESEPKPASEENMMPDSAPEETPAQREARE